jgi:hypothetical protein
MRFLMICLGLVAGLMFASPAAAQGFPPGPWHGAWTNGEQTYLYEAELDVTIEASGRVAGQIRWWLRRSPRAEEQRNIGRYAVEFVEGGFDAASGAMWLHGTEKQDPHNIISLDVYRLVASPDGHYIAGITSSEGTWDGRIELERVGPSG